MIQITSINGRLTISDKFDKLEIKKENITILTIILSYIKFIYVCKL